MNLTPPPPHAACHASHLYYRSNPRNATFEASLWCWLSVLFMFHDAGVAIASYENEHSQQHTNQTLHIKIELRTFGIYDNHQSRIERMSQVKMKIKQNTRDAGEIYTETHTHTNSSFGKER